MKETAEMRTSTILVPACSSRICHKCLAIFAGSVGLKEKIILFAPNVVVRVLKFFSAHNTTL
jgi:hypothetical protein